MPQNWFDPNEQLPPVDIPLVARWADGSEDIAVLRDGGSAWEWETAHQGDGLPVAWRCVGTAKHAAAVGVATFFSWITLLVATSAIVLALAGLNALALALVAGMLLLWSVGTLLRVATDVIMARHGALAALAVFVVGFLALAAGVVVVLLDAGGMTG